MPSLKIENMSRITLRLAIRHGSTHQRTEHKRKNASRF